ncbi:unnamed protein product [Ilex paraguariensis]|uniref:60S ribosomal protein L38 n=2 Tax=Ilex paraguariensis TaxID=185542 RepID=A0ABC8TR42_9AQUA
MARRPHRARPHQARPHHALLKKLAKDIESLKKPNNDVVEAVELRKQWRKKTRTALNELNSLNTIDIESIEEFKYVAFVKNNYAMIRGDKKKKFKCSIRILPSQDSEEIKRMANEAGIKHT